MSQIPEVASDRFSLPAIGFGTYALGGFDGARAVESALDEGYRLIDSAVSYENEGAVGAAVRAASEPRDDIIVTSKLPGRHHAHRAAVRTIEESLLRTGLDHLDLYLIHWPLPSRDLYIEAWGGLIEARDRGLVRAIGVSNFTTGQLDRLAAETGEVPVVNQIELHPYFPQDELLNHHRQLDIITEAWSPLGRGSDVMEQPVVVDIARDHDVTPSQVVLRWHVERGVVPIPKASSLEHQRANLDVFDFTLSSDEVDRITALGRPDGRLWDGDPMTYVEL